MSRHFQIIFFLAITFFLPPLFADLSIVDVRRNIPLSDEEPIYRDFYINGGESAGLKKNLVVMVVRSMAIRDSSGAQTYGEIQIPVGLVRILMVSDKLSVAREFKSLSRDENPMLEQTGIMSGDLILTKGSYLDASKPKRQPQAQEAAVPTPGNTPVTASLTLAPSAAPTATIPPKSLTDSAAAAPSAATTPPAITVPVTVGAASAPPEGTMKLQAPSNEVAKTAQLEETPPEKKSESNPLPEALLEKPQGTKEGQAP